MSSITETLFDPAPCHVFRLPSTDILKSENWEGNRIWSGSVELTRSNGECSIRLFEPGSNATFGACPLRDDDDDDGPKSIQQATDSTRCFVVRVEQGAQHAYLGIHFEDRSQAFNFNSAVLNRNKHKRAVEALPLHDRSLHHGEKVNIDLFGKIRTQTDSTSSSAHPTHEHSHTQPTQHVSLFDGPTAPVATSGASRRISSQQKASSATAVAQPQDPVRRHSPPPPTHSQTAPQNAPPPSAQGPPPSSTGNDPTDSSARAVPMNSSGPQAARGLSLLDDAFVPTDASPPPAQQPSSEPAKKKDALDELF